VSAPARDEEAGMTKRGQQGFSLVELMVAMLVTLLVSGAVFGLMTAGQGSFRREPALTDRQQNIRVAMEVIQRDLASGGAGMPAFQQVFLRQNLHNTALLNAQGPQGVNTGLAGRSDFLQVFGNDGQCPDLTVDPANPKDGNNLNMVLQVPPCFGEHQMVLVVFPPGTVPESAWGFAHNNHADDIKVNFPNGQGPPGSTVPGTPPWPVVPISVQRIQLVRYEIAPDADGVPSLWRSTTGGFNVDDDYEAAPSPGGFWQQAARGIEDMQVRYRAGGGAYADSPPVVADDDYTTIVRDVEVTLWARAIGANLQGQTVAPGQGTGVNAQAVRGSMVSVTTPRAALLALRDPAAGANQWR
jgi:prepilin-type N-terminal cleavage/methylation domain-containing protein